MVLAVDQGDVDRRAPQTLRDGKSAEPGPDDNDSRFVTVSHWLYTCS